MDSYLIVCIQLYHLQLLVCLQYPWMSNTHVKNSEIPHVKGILSRCN